MAARNSSTDIRGPKVASRSWRDGGSLRHQREKKRLARTSHAGREGRGALLGGMEDGLSRERSAVMVWCISHCKKACHYLKIHEGVRHLRPGQEVDARERGEGRWRIPINKARRA
jgi:hypothetical protein